mgnify:CR=1 FL=1
MSKTRVNIEIEVIGRDAVKKAHFSLSSGNVSYFRANAKTLTAKYTYQQLAELIERDLADDESLE